MKIKHTQHQLTCRKCGEERVCGLLAACKTLVTVPDRPKKRSPGPARSTRVDGGAAEVDEVEPVVPGISHLHSSHRVGSSRKKDTCGNEPGAVRTQGSTVKWLWCV